MRYFMTIVAFSLLSGCGVSESPSEVMAPTGTLRAVFLGGNPVQGRLDSETGTATGTVPDLVERLAGQLGVSYTLLPAENARAVMDRLIDGEADLGFLAYSESRALEVDYGAAYLVMFSSYLVGANSSFETSADVDRSGISVGAVRGQSQELFVSSQLRNAQVRVFDTVPSQTEFEMLLASGEVDAFAINRQRALDAEEASASLLRALSDSFMEVDQAFVVPKGDFGKLEIIEEFVAEALATGFVRASIERAQLRSVDVPSGRER
jgi:polar amino acid transport system substrate-binding protein